VKSEEKDSFRMTTVIKSPEGRFWSKLNDVLEDSFELRRTPIYGQWI
jgi:hypothetical protein